MALYIPRQPQDNLLYQTIAKNLKTFLAQLDAEDKRLPQHVEKEFQAYLKCGVLAYGFARLQCTDCHKEKLLAFSCKKRGFCASCSSKRMAEVAAHLTDNILPRAPYRQYVLSVPIQLRYWMATNKKLTAKVHKIMAEEIENFYLQQATVKKLSPLRSGSVTFIQRFGGAINLNVHFHMLQMNGVFGKKRSKLVFKKISPPNNQDITKILERIRQRIIKLLLKRGYLQTESQPKALFEDAPIYPATMEASILQRIALGERAGLPVRFIKGRPLEARVTGPLCVEIDGFSLHAAVAIPAHRRDRLEKLIRYMARPAVCTNRLSLQPNGDLRYEFKHPWRDGRTHVVLSPLEFIEKLCALIPLPNMHLTRYSGVLAPHSKYRSKVIPGKTRVELRAEAEANEVPVLQRGSWAKLLARVFSIDMTHCEFCGGEVKVLARIFREDIIAKILLHLGLDPRPPPVSPPRTMKIFAMVG